MDNIACSSIKDFCIEVVTIAISQHEVVVESQPHEAGWDDDTWITEVRII